MTINKTLLDLKPRKLNMNLIDRILITFLVFWSRTYEPTTVELYTLLGLAIGFAAVWHAGAEGYFRKFIAGYLMPGR